jgi:hypothetical protein
MSEAELIEKLAAIEHERWASWQGWLHSHAEPQFRGESKKALLLSASYVENLERRIATPYDQLSEAEKQSDRDQVMRYLHLVRDYYTSLIKPTISEVQDLTPEITGKTSDGYHTFDELYEFRMLYNAAFFNEIRFNPRYNVHKSRRHNDGEKCFGGGWFIVMATLPSGQISNHYPDKDWKLFKCEERDRADEYDGHTPADVAKRLRKWLQ